MILAPVLLFALMLLQVDARKKRDGGDGWEDDELEGNETTDAEMELEEAAKNGDGNAPRGFNALLRCGSRYIVRSTNSPGFYPVGHR